ncbi:U3-containing 90S pre-ribosomal complex subunit-domain containing protein [Myxozyma melibiosi]|uniref:U3-containing 90S pre-ribosomal complex subunit-domain containing protein n=1 Tax=Myxozyma melibiosi TaxID=54550 RepID=A0ABR1FCU9_9ASCO
MSAKKSKVQKKVATAAVGGGDDLDDGLLYEVDDATFASDEDDGGVVVSGGEEDEVKDDAVKEATGTATVVATETSALAAAKKAEKRKKMKERIKQKKRQRMETEVTVKTTIAGVDSSIIADYFAKKARLFFPKLSTVELDDLCVVKQDQIMDMTGWKLPRDDKNFEKFLTQVAKPRKLNELPSEKGAPYVIIISISGIRVCEVRRALPKPMKSAKLISKNSIASDSKYLANSTISIALSTSERLRLMLDYENPETNTKTALSLENLELVVVDSTFLDSKARSVLDDVPETLKTVKRLLVGAPGAKVVLY